MLLLLHPGLQSYVLNFIIDVPVAFRLALTCQALAQRVDSPSTWEALDVHLDGMLVPFMAFIELRPRLRTCRYVFVDFHQSWEAAQLHRPLQIAWVGERVWERKPVQSRDVFISHISVPRTVHMSVLWWGPVTAFVVGLTDGQANWDDFFSPTEGRTEARIEILKVIQRPGGRWNLHWFSDGRWKGAVTRDSPAGVDWSSQRPFTPSTSMDITLQWTTRRLTVLVNGQLLATRCFGPTTGTLYLESYMRLCWHVMVHPDFQRAVGSNVRVSIRPRPTMLPAGGLEVPNASCVLCSSPRALAVMACPECSDLVCWRHGGACACGFQGCALCISRHPVRRACS